MNNPVICTLSSGSSGNCVYVSSGETSLLIDAGISMKATEMRLNALGSSLENISAVLVTHEHSDHIKGLEMISKYYKIPIYAPSECVRYFPEKIDRSLVCPMDNSGYELLFGNIFVKAFPTPHDSAASVGYVIEIEGRKFGLATDMGMPTTNVAKALLGCESIIIEANYERQMLENGPYPYFLKQRVASSTGHLENTDCARMIAYLALEGGTKSFLLAHLSKTNNTPERALESVGGYLASKNISVNLLVAGRNELSYLVG